MMKASRFFLRSRVLKAQLSLSTHIEYLHSDNEVVSKKGRVVNANGPLVQSTPELNPDC